MKRKIAGISLAVILAIVGTVVLMAYVNKAKDDAVKDSAQVQVLVVTKPIAQGTPVAEIAQSVELDDVPQRLVVDDSLITLDNLDPTFVNTVALQPGEQLLSSRLADPRTLVRVDVPKGLQEITLSLDPARAVGGALQPGEMVGILLSFDPFDINTASEPQTSLPSDPTQTTVQAPTRTPNTTNLTLSQVLVTSVQYSFVDSQRISGVDNNSDNNTSDTSQATVTTVSEAPSNVLLVTLAVTTSQAEQITFAAEFGHIYLTRQNDDTDTNGSRIITLDQVYVTVPE